MSIAPPSQMLRVSRWAIALCLAFGSLAATVYPGGTVLDSGPRGYSFLQNSISDLGMTVAHDGRANPLGAGLFVGSFTLLSLSVGACAIGFVQLHMSSVRARPFAQTGAAGALAAGACLLAAGIAPANLLASLHLWAARSACIIAPPSLLLLAVAAAKDRRFPASVAVIWLVLAFAVTVWFAMPWGAAITTPRELAIRASAQKLLAVVVVGAVTYQAYRAGKVAERPNWECRS